MYLIWQPVLRSDDRATAMKRSDEFTDDRIQHFWDDERFTGELWKPILGTKDLPWDVYFLYGANTKWKETPTPPDYWMRRMTEGKVPRFVAKVREITANSW